MYTYNFKDVGETFNINVPKDLNKLDILKPEKLKEQYGGSYKVYFNVQNTTAKFLTFYIKTTILCAVSPKSDFSCELPQEVFTDYLIECRTMQNDEVYIADSGNDIIITFTEGMSLGYSNNYNNNIRNLGGNTYTELNTLQHVNDITTWIGSYSTVTSNIHHDFKSIKTTNTNNSIAFNFSANDKFYNKLTFNGVLNASITYSNNSSFVSQGNTWAPLAYIIPNTNYVNYITGDSFSDNTHYDTYYPTFNSYLVGDWFSDFNSTEYGLFIDFMDTDNNILDRVFINCINNSNTNISQPFVKDFSSSNNFSPVLLGYNNNTIIDNYQTLINFSVPINDFLKDNLKYKIEVKCDFYVMYVAYVLKSTVITYKATINYYLQGFWRLS